MSKKEIIFGVGSVAIFALDLFTKSLAKKFFVEPLEIFSFLGFELTQNSQLAFGLPLPRIWIILFSLLAIIFLGNLFVKNVQKKSKIGAFAFALVFGGAFGNLFERVFLSEVTDFIRLAIIPNFNLADAALSIGVVLLIVFHQKIFIKI